MNQITNLVKGPLKNLFSNSKRIGKLSMMRACSVLVFVTIVLFATATSTATAGEIAAPNGDGSAAISTGIGQSFTARCSGTLSQLKVLSPDEQTNRTIIIYQGEGITGTILGKVEGVNLHNASGFLDYSIIDLSAANVSLTDGEVYTFYLINPNELEGNIVGLYQSELDHYADGIAFYEGISHIEYDLIFILNITISPQISMNNSNLAYTENDVATQIDAAATVSDDDWNDGNLRAEITANVEASDEISISDTDGDGLTITISGTDILSNGTDVGDLSAPGGVVTGGTNLVITFDSDATNDIVQEVLQSLRYRNTSDNPGISNRTITITATDTDLGSSSDSRTVNVIAVNDDPELSGLPSDITVNEDIASNVDLSAALLNDVDAGSSSITLIISAGSGTLSASSGGGVVISGSGTGELTLVGTAANIDIYLNTASNIMYTGDSNVNGNDATTLILKANDGGSTGHGGGGDVSLGTVNIDITSVNDEPTFSAFSSVLDTTNENTEVEITLADLKAQGDEHDVDGTVDAFIVKSLSSGTLKIGANSGVATIFNDTTNKTINASNNAYWTPDNSASGIQNAFTITALDNSGAESSGAVQATVMVNAALPTVGFNKTSSNGLESISSVNLQVDLSEVSGLDVTVDYTVTGTATGNGTDYTLTDGTLTINAGEANANITIASIVDDLLDEYNETVIVTLSNPINATLGTNTVHTYTINDNDASPTVDFNITSSNGLESISSANLQVDLSEVSGLDVTVDYTVTGTATGNGTDYTLTDGTLTINAGEANANITIASIVDDLLDEYNETVIVTLSNPINATLGINTVHTYTINDNDDTVPLIITTAASNITATKATFNGMVNANNQSTEVSFEYGLTPGYGITVLTDQSPVSGITNTSVSKEITGLLPNTTYHYRVIGVNATGTVYGVDVTFTTSTDDPPVHHGGGSRSTSPSTTTGTDILVNGVLETAATSTTTMVDNKTVTTITLDDKKVEERLEKEGNHCVVTIPYKNDSDVAIGQLNGQTVKNMETKEAVLEMKSEHVTYALPAAEINIDRILSQMGQKVERKDIKVTVRIAASSQKTVQIVQDTANRNSYQVVVKPLDFEITCISGNKTVGVSKFNGYVERRVLIPNGIDPSKITTGVVLNEDGTFSHVPTAIIKIDGKYYAKIYSLTNSTYSVIWNEKNFVDVSNHWAKDAINDMGSRLVIGGIGNNRFEPGRDITRAEYATIVVNALGLMKPVTGKDLFNDVKESAWYYDAICIANEYSLISGYDNGKFRPNDKITREQAMVILSRAMQITKLNAELGNDQIDQIVGRFNDAEKVTRWAKQDVARCVQIDIVSGTGEKILAPQEKITRAEVAVIVKRLLQKSSLI